MFNATKVIAGIDAVQNVDQLVDLLAKSIGYTFGDKFCIANYKLGTSSTLPDEEHPGWEWQPITGRLYTVASCNVPSEGVVAFVTGTRQNDRTKTVLCLYSPNSTARSKLASKLAAADGDSTIGAKLADMLGYSDWCVVTGSHEDTDSNYYTYSAVEATGVVTATGRYITPIELVLPDDGSHSHNTVYDPYSGLGLLDQITGLPTMLLWFWNGAVSASTLVMSKSSYDADFQNTVDIIHSSLAKEILSVAARVTSSEVDVQGLIAANGALYAAISTVPVFGAKFAEVVDAWQRIESSSSYIPRP